MSKSSFQRLKVAAAAVLVTSAITAGGPAAKTLSAHSSTVQKSIHLALPAFGHGRFYKIVVSEKVSPGQHLSAADVELRLGNPGSLPANVRAAWAQTRPRASHGTWTDDFLIAINFPRSLGGRDLMSAHVSANFMDLLIEYFNGTEVAPVKMEVQGCDEAAQLLARWGQYPRNGQLTNGQSTPRQIALRTKGDCK